METNRDYSIVDLGKTPLSQSRLWQPIAGEETLTLIDSVSSKLSQEEQDILVREAVEVLSRCAPPDPDASVRTGLVVGYVQSGKTLSFTTVAALAKDNGFPLIIVIAGTSIPLFTQSEERLKSDLRIGSRLDRKWKLFSNPRLDKRHNIEATLRDWNSTDNNIGKQTILMTVMKNYVHLQHLNKLLCSIDLSTTSVLVIDDEADQAGLNTSVNKGEQSTTYQCLLELRRNLPRHSYLQYTATPQAPLLINIIDILSPDFAEVLTPGAAYTGGKIFFDREKTLVCRIRPSEVPTKKNQLLEPPDSLLYAIQLFYLGVADALVKEDGNPKANRSMMIHPSQRTIPHTQYTTWVKAIRINWETILTDLGTANNRDRNDLVADFHRAYLNLGTTVSNLSSFDDLVSELGRAVRITMVTEVNSKPLTGTPQVDWGNDYAHILIGGQAMDRGFTVEGLTVTYMPRGKGTGNADTIQQRARFFGYKKPYLGYCRVFLEDESRDIFKAYVDHEEDIRKRLLEHKTTNKPLSHWKRAFFLDDKLKPTRKNVLDLPFARGKYSDAWFSPSAPHDSDEAIEENRILTKKLLRRLPLKPDTGHPERTEMQKHSVAEDVPLLSVFRDFLTLLRVPSPGDSQNFTGLLLQVKRYLEANPESSCTIYHMSKGQPRQRGLDENGGIRNLFQGAHPDTKGRIYPGDRKVFNRPQLTIQIHNLMIDTPEGLKANVPAIAVWVPKSMATSWLSQ